MTTKDMIRKTAHRTRLNQRTTKAVLTAALEIIAEALATGDRVQLHDLGTIKTIERKQKQKYNFLTGGIDEIPARRGVKMIPAKALRVALSRLEDGSKDPASRPEMPVDAPGKD